MRKFSDVKGEEALDVLAEIIVPITALANDEEVRKGMEVNVANCVAIALKKYKTEIIDIITAVNGKSKKETLKELDLLTLPAYFGDILSNPTIQSLFR